MFEEDDDVTQGHPSVMDNIWGSTGANTLFNFDSPLRDLLDAHNYNSLKLTDVLAQDELLQELKCESGSFDEDEEDEAIQLVKYFCQRDVLQELIRYLNPENQNFPSTPPPPDVSVNQTDSSNVDDKDDVVIYRQELGYSIDETNSTDNIPNISPLDDDNVKLDDEFYAIKCPFMACEVICCAKEAILNSLLRDGGEDLDLLMNVMLSKKEDSSTLGDRTAGYLDKILSTLFLHKPKDMASWVDHYGKRNERENSDETSTKDDKVNLRFLEDLIPHIHCYAIRQIIGKLLHEGSQDDLSLGDNDLSSSDDEDILVDEHGGDRSESFLCRLNGSSDAIRFLFKTFSEKLEVKNQNLSSVSLNLSESIDHLSEILCQYPPTGPIDIQPTLSVMQIYEAICARSCSEVSMAVDWGKMKFMLTDKDDNDENQRVGALRLCVLNCIESLVIGHSHDEEMMSSMLESGIIKVLIELFFKFKWCNALHNSVTTILIHALEMKNEDKVNGGAGNGIKDYLLGEECGLMPGLIDAFEQNRKEIEGGGFRLGFMGHVINLCKAINNVVVVDDVAAEDLPTNQQNWYTFILTHLKEAIDDQDQALGGGRSHEGCLSVDDLDPEDAARIISELPFNCRSEDPSYPNYNFDENPLGILPLPDDDDKDEVSADNPSNSPPTLDLFTANFEAAFPEKDEGTNGNMTVSVSADSSSPDIFFEVDFKNAVFEDLASS